PLSIEPVRAPQPDHTPVAALRAAQTAAGCYTCAAVESATDLNGKEFMRLRLRAASGEDKAIHFDPADEASGLSTGYVAVVYGTFNVHAQYGPQVQVRRLRLAAENEYDLAELVPVSPVDPGELAERLHALIDSVSQPAIRALLERAFD